MDKKKIKKYGPIAMVLALPLIFIFGVAIYLNFTTRDIDLQHDFLFTSESNFLTVKDNHVAPESGSDFDGVELDGAKIWRYSVEEDTIERVSFEEAKEFTLNTNDISPDGYKVTLERHQFNPFPFEHDESAYIVSTEENRARKIDLDNKHDEYYMRELPNLGWIVEE